MMKEAQDLKNEVILVLFSYFFANMHLRLIHFDFLGSRGLDRQLLWSIPKVPLGSF